MESNKVPERRPVQGK